MVSTDYKTARKDIARKAEKIVCPYCLTQEIILRRWAGYHMLWCLTCSTSYVHSNGVNSDIDELLPQVEALDDLDR
jgi:hypothetical protein